MNFLNLITYYILYNFKFYSYNKNTLLCVGGILKSFSINVSDKDTANFLKDYLDDNLKEDFNVSLDGDDEDFIINILFLNDDKKVVDNFVYYLSNFIIDNYEKKLVDYIFDDEYFYFTNDDRRYIYNIYLEFKNLSFENECLTCVEKSIKFYLYKECFLDLNGFIYFGVYNYTKKIKTKVCEAINSFVVEKEYEKFLDMLKNYIESSDSKIYKIHLIYLNSNATLLDNNGNNIKLENISNNMILSDFDFSKNDYVLNTLITLSPRQIVLHLLSPEDNFIDAIMQIFTTRVSICKDCKYCKKFRNNI